MDSIVKNLIEYVGINQQIPADYSVSIFKELMIQEHVTLSDCFPDIEQITRVTVCVEIKNAYVIDTPISNTNTDGSIINSSGQILTGKKLVIDGIIHQMIHYVADTDQQQVVVLDNNYSFGTFAVLPATASISNSHYIITPYIEDIMVDIVDARNITKCISLFLEVK